jgi:hypothetical protein
MTAVYLLIVLAPLAPAALHSGVVARAISGECAGDCRICGCSPERSSSGTCCCALKKLAGKRREQTAAAGECSDCKAPPHAVKKAGSSCCSTAKKASARLDHDECALPLKSSRETIITALPCGSWKMLAFGGIEILHMPFEFRSSIPCPEATPISKPFIDRLTSYQGEPPDPPPKIAARS